MKKAFLIYLSIFLILPASSDAVYKEGFFSKLYVRANIALPLYSKLTEHAHENNVKFMVFPLVAVGTHFHHNYSMEIEALYRDHRTSRSYAVGGTSSSRFTAYGALLNLLAYSNKMHINIRNFTPYIGAGVGYSHNKTEGLLWSSLVDGEVLQGRDTNNFISQLILGGNYNINSDLYIAVDMRYLYLGKFKHESIAYTTDSVGNSHNIIFTTGIKYKF